MWTLAVSFKLGQAHNGNELVLTAAAGPPRRCYADHRLSILGNEQLRRPTAVPFFAVAVDQSRDSYAVLARFLFQPVSNTRKPPLTSFLGDEREDRLIRRGRHREHDARIPGPLKSIISNEKNRGADAMCNNCGC